MIRHLPLYSSDLNLIEKLFFKLKAVLRKVPKRTRQTLWDEIGRLNFVSRKVLTHQDYRFSLILRIF
ncbi:MAG: hypothetical protein KF908_15250 [Nitrosomonas sp.]|nr:hypothetical protein [Nitrosomonas sp.]MCW5609003.1 hypothetical protein [Nitrosomonas sp.]